MWSIKQLVEPESALLQRALRSCDSLIPLKSLRQDFLERLFQEASIECIPSDQTFFTENSWNTKLFYLLHGKVVLTFSVEKQHIISVGESLLPIRFGIDQPCEAHTLEDSTILIIDSERLDQLLSWSQVSEYLISELVMRRTLDDDIEWMKTVLQSNLFFKIPPVNAESIFKVLLPMVVEHGDVILQQGDVGDCCYFIKEGTADIWRTEEGEVKARKVAQISAGRCFGEDALVNSALRNSSVVMSSDGVLMRIEKNDFILLLHEPAIDELNKHDIDELFDEPIYIDVRTSDEYGSGHLPKSANIPINLLAMKKRLLNDVITYVLYCDTGRRSRTAAYFLAKQGYNVFAMAGGYRGQKLSSSLTDERTYLLRDGRLAKSVC